MERLWTPWRRAFVEGAADGRAVECFLCTHAADTDDRTNLVVHRAERARARLARLVSIGALIALVATALVLFATDWVTAQRVPAAASHAKVQP